MSLIDSSVVMGVTAQVKAARYYHSSDGISSYINNLRSTNSLSRMFGLSFVKMEHEAEGCIQAGGYAQRVLVELLGSRGFLDLEGSLNNCRLFHATDYYIPRFKKIAVLATLHDPIPLMYPCWTRGWFRHIKSRTLQTTVRWADRYIAISDAVIPDLVQYFNIAPERMTRVYHGVDDLFFYKIDFDFIFKVKAKYFLKDTFFLFIGTLQPRKNLGRLLDAFMALPLSIQKVHPLVVVGRNGWSVVDDVRRLQSLQAQGRAVWLQNVNDDEKRCLLQSALALVFPSLYEGFGLPILEAFASGLPVITSNVSAMPEIAGDAALLVNPLEVEEIAFAMRRIAESPTLAFELSEKGRIRAREFTWQKTAEQTMAVYREMM